MMHDDQRKQAISAYEQAYSASDFEVIQARYRKKLLLELFEKYQPKHVLEVGCGWDTIANHWQGFESLTIVEPGPQFAEKARKDTAQLAGAQVIEAFLESSHLGKPDPAYDLILLSSLLHEVPDAKALLASAKALAGQNTVIHINVPNALSMHRLLAVEMGLMDSVYAQSALQKSFNQPRIFDLKQLKVLAKELGLQVLEAGSFLVKPFTHHQMMTLMQQGLLTQEMLDGLWQLARHFPENGSEIYVNLKLED